MFSSKIANSPSARAVGLCTTTCKPSAGISPFTLKLTVNSSPSLSSVCDTEIPTVGPTPGPPLPSIKLKLPLLASVTMYSAPSTFPVSSSSSKLKSKGSSSKTSLNMLRVILEVFSNKTNETTVGLSGSEYEPKARPSTVKSANCSPKASISLTSRSTCNPPEITAPFSSNSAAGISPSTVNVAVKALFGPSSDTTSGVMVKLTCGTSGTTS